MAVRLVTRKLLMLFGILVGLVLAYRALVGQSHDETHSNLGQHSSKIGQHSTELSEHSNERANRHGPLQITMNDLSPHWSFRPKFLDTAADVQISDKPRIPRILHQVWDTDDIPQRFVNWIRTWKIVNPAWEYRFWTLGAVRELIARHFSDHLVLYDSYTAPVFRADAMRYFVLYTYGGVYADLDMDAIRPLDNWTSSYDCLVSEESYEHAFVIHEQAMTNIMNGFLACRPKHALMKLAIDSLQDAARKYFGEYLRATGPLFFNNVYARYKAGHVGTDEVTVVPPRYFLPTCDDSESDTISGKCAPVRVRDLPLKGQLMCRELVTRGFSNEAGPTAYANHHWLHAYMFDESWKKLNTVTIKRLVPSVVFGSDVVSATVV